MLRIYGDPDGEHYALTVRRISSRLNGVGILRKEMAFVFNRHLQRYFNICYEEIPGVCRDAGGTGCGVNFNAFRYVY